MPATPTTADRAAEFTRLLDEQATLIRSMKYGHQAEQAEHCESERRAGRLIELAELLDADNPGAYVNERIASWIRSNPLPLGVRDLHEVAEQYKEEGKNLTVTVSIGAESGPGAGYHYRLMRDDVDTGYQRGSFTLKVPDAVAEHFRQQGRRAIQAELRDLLNTPRA